MRTLLAFALLVLMFAGCAPVSPVGVTPVAIPTPVIILRAQAVARNGVGSISGYNCRACHEDPKPDVGP